MVYETGAQGIVVAGLLERLGGTILLLLSLFT